MILTTYHISDIDDMEDFINNLFKGLSYYKKKYNGNIRFKIKWNKNTVELITSKVNDYNLN